MSDPEFQLSSDEKIKVMDMFKSTTAKAASLVDSEFTLWESVIPCPGARMAVIKNAFDIVAEEILERMTK